MQTPFKKKYAKELTPGDLLTFDKKSFIMFTELVRRDCSLTKICGIKSNGTVLQLYLVKENTWFYVLDTGRQK